MTFKRAEMPHSALYKPIAGLVSTQSFTSMLMALQVIGIPSTLMT